MATVLTLAVQISAPLGILLILLGVAAVFLLLLLAVRSMLRDRRHGSSGALASAVLEVESLLDPSKRHVQESVQSEEEEDDESGDPPSR